MSRAERLLELMQCLRRYRVPVSGPVLASEIGISLRTLYRDIASLQAQGANMLPTLAEMIAMTQWPRDRSFEK